MVFDEFFTYGVTPIYKGTPIIREEVENISLDKAKEALAETKVNLGINAIHELYKDKLAVSDNMWREISNNSPDRENLQPCIVEVEAKGISAQAFAKYSRYLEESGGLALSSKIHPEHYTVDVFPGGQLIMETFGMYKVPTYMKLEMSNDGFKPIKPDTDTQMLMCGTMELMSDGTDTKMIGMHQFKFTENGVKIKLGVFLPQAAPKEMVEGHKYHFAVEFNNVLHYVAEM